MNIKFVLLIITILTFKAFGQNDVNGFKINEPNNLTTIRNKTTFRITWNTGLNNVFVNYHVYFNNNTKENINNFNIFIGQTNRQGGIVDLQWNLSNNDLSASEHCQIKIVGKWRDNNDSVVFKSDIFAIEEYNEDTVYESLITQGSLENITSDKYGTIKIGYRAIAREYDYEVSGSIDNSFPTLNTSNEDLYTLFILLPYQGKTNISLKYFNRKLFWKIPLNIEANIGKADWDITNSSQSIQINKNAIYAGSIYLGLNFKRNNFKIENSAIIPSLNIGGSIKWFSYSDKIESSIENLLGTKNKVFYSLYCYGKVILNTSNNFDGTILFLNIDLNIDNKLKNADTFNFNLGIQVQGKVFSF